MPRVPGYDQPQERLQGLQGGQQQSVASPAMFDTGGASLQRMGGELLKAATEMQADINEAKVKEKDVALSDQIRAILHDPEKGYLNQVGGAAVKGHPDVTKTLRELTKGMESDFDNDRQRRIFNEAAQRRIASALDQVSVHAGRETKVYAAGESKARAEAQVSDLVVNWNDPKRFGIARQTMLDELNHYADLAGMGKEDAQRKDLILGATTKAHGAVLDNIMSLNRSQDARAYFEAHKEEIDPQQHDNIRKALENVSVKDDSLKLSMSLPGDLPSQRKELKAQYESGKISAEVYDATQQRIEHDWSVRKSMQNESEKYAFGQAQDFLLKHPNKTVFDLPTNIYNSLKENGHLTAAAAITSNPPTDWAKYYELRQEAIKDPEKFKSRNLFVDFPNLGRSEREGLIDLQTKAGKNDMLDATTLDGQLSNTHDLLAWGSGDMAKKGAFDAAVVQAVSNEQKQIGRKLNQDERQKIIDRMLIQGEVSSGSMFLPDPNKRVYELTPDEARKFVPTIPSTERQKITDALKRKGKPVSESEIVRLYKAKNGLQ